MTETPTERQDGQSDRGPQRLLLVEDEEHLARGLKLNLEMEGYAVEVAGTARAAGEKLLDSGGYDAIVLDVMLPDIDGFELCKRLRESGNYVPVIMLTARSSAEDRVRGLEVGADDYMVKPFQLGELLARVRSMLRRRRWERGSERAPQDAVLAFGRARVNFETHDVEVEGQQARLTQLEIDLLRYLSRNPNRVVGRDELLEKVWKVRSSASRRTVDNFIARLRKHFEADPSNPKHFVSVRGAGYKFVPAG